MYGVMIALGIIIALFPVLYGYSKKLKINEKLTDFIYYNAIVSIGLGFGSAALFQATYEYIENPAAGFNLGAGITFLGGLIGGIVVFMTGYAIFRNKLGIRLIDSLSLIPCAILIGHSFGRVGCFFAGCCYGKPTDSFIGVLFPGHTVPVHPTQLYEASFLLIMFIVCSVLLLKFKFRHNMSVYLVGYGIFRFLLEFVRDDDRGQLVAGISPSQFWSLLMIVAGVALIFLVNYLWEKREAELLIGEGAEESTEESAEETAEESTEETAEESAKE
jgi:phosphatidylglycerol:prolipoprotein diacylglycerol transferase